MNYVDFFKWQVTLGKNSRFLPKVNFSKREGLFTLYYYPSKDSYICRYRFFYDGGEVLPVIGEWEEGGSDEGLVPVSLPAFISRYFSFNITNLRKAIHRRSTSKASSSSGMSKTNSSSGSSNTSEEKANAPYRSVRLKPRIALINKDFFGVKQVRGSRDSRNSEPSWHSRLSSSQELLLIAKQAADSFDFNLFPNFFSLAKSLFPSISEKTAFSVFKKFVLDFQSS